MNEEQLQTLVRAMAMTAEANALLTGLLVSIGEAASVPEPGPLTEVPACQHPEDARQSIAAMGNVGAWRCAACGYIYERPKE